MSILLLVKSPLLGFPQKRHIPSPLLTSLFPLYALSSVRPIRPSMIAQLRNTSAPPQEAVRRLGRCVPSDTLLPTSCSFCPSVSTPSCQNPIDSFSLCRCRSSPFSFHPTSPSTSLATSAPLLMPFLLPSLVILPLFALPPAAPAKFLWADDACLRTSSSAVSVVVFFSRSTEKSSALSPSSAPFPFCDSAPPASPADL